MNRWGQQRPGQAAADPIDSHRGAEFEILAALMRKESAHIIDACTSAEGVDMEVIESGKHMRKPTNLSLDSRLLQEAKALGINVSRAAEAGIADAVRRNKRERWLIENAAALDSSNLYVETNRLPLSRHRQF